MTKKLRQIAFYGKRGLGKSTTSQNTLAQLTVPTPIDMDELERLLIDFSVVEDEDTALQTQAPK
ncbi:hypothetical protein [Paenibacillus durus]|uniref:Uncharacterized protein n=1 Tax=Paenibacillus durus TaxID=44251 RepID=A0A089HRU0_PAEDU|nr:hypothetical protein [Paenibacillus durus]AIQ13420.1 hypothetical protein PDUR_16985 [Paenibacillus durus]